jgi:hypothetical protein
VSVADGRRGHTSAANHHHTTNACANTHARACWQEQQLQPQQILRLIDSCRSLCVCVPAPPLAQQIHLEPQSIFTTRRTLTSIRDVVDRTHILAGWLACWHIHSHLIYQNDAHRQEEGGGRRERGKRGCRSKPTHPLRFNPLRRPWRLLQGMTAVAAAVAAAIAAAAAAGSQEQRRGRHHHHESGVGCCGWCGGCWGN